MSIRIRRLATGRSHERGLIDTSVVIELRIGEIGDIPLALAVSSLTLAELAGGPAAASDRATRARRQERVGQVESFFEALPFDAECAQAYARVYAAVLDVGRKPRGPRVLDLLIAATALAHTLPLYTLKPADLRGLENLIEIVDLA